jgi:catechol 2,3-dioxygenase-like lactoylglutathione lyase family enzyme
MDYNGFKEEPMMPTTPPRRVGEPPGIETVVETAIYADDLEAMESFYHGVLGLPRMGKEPGRHVFFRVGAGSVLLVFQPQSTRQGGVLPAHGATGPGHFALGIRPDLLSAWRQHLIAHGVEIEKEVAWPGGAMSLYFRDPAGNVAELITPGLWGTPAGW